MKPRVGISHCLLGEKVRYDGDHKRSRVVVEVLGKHFEWVPICPEVDIGMGVPREPVHLFEDEGHIRLLGVTSGYDWTDSMNEYAEGWTSELASGEIHGFVLKSNSPSCGIDGVKLDDCSGAYSRNGVGLFTRVLQTQLPALPIVDEQSLKDACVCEDFISTVHEYRDWLQGQQ
jgi:uncharacterized protein YbbK (DUF523 family)|tara:strand:- start:1249 stop:1770 length:522 start_codon:yes stop_codon:yes gene_type:complete